MDERDLLILGLLKSQPLHGYKINEFIKTFLGTIMDMKKSTAYYILKRLEKQGFVQSSVEQEGARPSRQVYAITSKGENVFEELLEKMLTHVENTVMPGEVSFMFLDYLPQDKIIPILQKRLGQVSVIIQIHEKSPRHINNRADLSISYRITVLKCMKSWLENTINELVEQLKIS
ncbi:PadR family transcriptional regulator [Bacillus pseudomycoides]|nr:PadR family transcriptional regulator [Bacillus pseudomycoides]